MPTQLEAISVWDEIAGEWDDMAAGHAKGFYALLQEKVSITTDMNVFDFGCGTGLIADILRKRVKKVVAVDASSCMVEIFEEKIQAQEWDNVQVYHALMGDPDAEDTQKIMRENEGTIDLIIASSVLGFVTKESVASTMAALGRLLKPGGYFCHTDTPKSEVLHPNPFTETKAQEYYEKGGLVLVSTSIENLNQGMNQSCKVFFGVARKPS